jgi:hypothetical protein
MEPTTVDSETEPQQLQRRAFDGAREVALWIRDSSLGFLGFTVVLGVALAGWTVSFIGLHTFAIQHMGLTWSEGWLVPVTFDGAPFGLTLVVMRAASFGRSAWFWRLLIIAFTALSSAINYIHIDDAWGHWVAALMPPSAVVVFEGIVSEARMAADRRNGIKVRPRLHVLRFVFDWTGSWDIIRRHVLNQPLPEGFAATRSRPATASRPRADASANAATPKAASAPQVPASATPSMSASPASASPSQALPEPALAASASPASTPSSGPATTPAGSQAKTTSSQAGAPEPAAGNEARDLDEVATVFRKLQAELGKSPSDKALGEALGVGRSRAQQLRNAAIEAGHTDLAKPLRAA